jgi:hypothetical protein
VETGQCSCSKMESVGLGTLNKCLEHVERQAEDFFAVSQLEEQDRQIFAYDGRFGVIANCDREIPWKKSTICFPTSFGFFTVGINNELSISREDVASEIEAILVFFDANDNKHDVWTGRISTNGRRADPSSFIVSAETSAESRVPDIIKNYNWKCLITCAPGCYFNCHSDLQCWAICAGSCLLTCAL